MGRQGASSAKACGADGSVNATHAQAPGALETEAAAPDLLALWGAPAAPKRRRAAGTAYGTRAPTPRGPAGAAIAQPHEQRRLAALPAAGVDRPALNLPAAMGQLPGHATSSAGSHSPRSVSMEAQPTDAHESGASFQRPYARVRALPSLMTTHLPEEGEVTSDNGDTAGPDAEGKNVGASESQKRWRKGQAGVMLTTAKGKTMLPGADSMMSDGLSTTGSSIPAIQQARRKVCCVPATGPHNPQPSASCASSKSRDAEDMQDS